MALRSLKIIAKRDNYELRPNLIMSDFEVGLQNAISDVFQINKSDNGPKLVGCYFHFVKALVKKAISLGLVTRKKTNNNGENRIKILISLLKILIYAQIEEKEKFFQEIETIYNNCGDKFKTFLSYFKKNWLNNHFLNDLISFYSANDDIAFLRTNNPCELFNKYLGKFKYFLINIIRNCF